MAQSYFNLQIWKNDKQTPYLVPSRNKKNATHTWTSHILKKNHIQIDASSLRHSKKKNVHVNSQINNSLPAHKIYSIHTSSWVHHKIFGNEEKKNSRLRMPQTSTKTTKGTNKYHMYLEIMCTAHPNCTTNMRSPTPPHYLFAHSPPLTKYVLVVATKSINGKKIMMPLLESWGKYHMPKAKWRETPHDSPQRDEKPKPQMFLANTR